MRFLCFLSSAIGQSHSLLASTLMSQALLAHTLFIEASGVYDSAVGVAVWCWVQGEGAAVVFVHVVNVTVGGSVLLLLLPV